MHLTLVRYIACYCTLIIITVIYTENKVLVTQLPVFYHKMYNYYYYYYLSVAHDLKEGQKINLKDKLSSKALFTQRYLS